MPIVGREPELRRVDEFLDAIQAGPIALVLEGEIGIGKTALWKQGLAAAVARSHRVLSCADRSTPRRSSPTPPACGLAAARAGGAGPARLAGGAATTLSAGR